jgi:hypothetical protein
MATGGSGPGPTGGKASTSTGGSNPGIGVVCDWTDPSCEDLSCKAQCPTDDSDYCVTACKAIIDCAGGNDCGTPADPLCVNREQGNANECSVRWESAGGNTMAPNNPAAVALDYAKCACGL